MSRGSVIIEREIFIAASPETIFAFLIDPALMTRWFGIKNMLEPRPGGVFSVRVALDHLARGVFREVVPHRKVAFTLGLGIERSVTGSTETWRVTRRDRTRATRGRHVGPFAS